MCKLCASEVEICIRSYAYDVAVSWKVVVKLYFDSPDAQALLRSRCGR